MLPSTLRRGICKKVHLLSELQLTSTDIFLASDILISLKIQEVKTNSTVRRFYNWN